MSKLSIMRMPPRPATMFSQALEMLLPTGETIPRPVITTRRLDKTPSLFLVQELQQKNAATTGRGSGGLRVAFEISPDGR
ncbi:hypothetical protein QVG61_06880 [Thiohalobacter sp. IOR34]|uniref:hypothetical protein n=1 Tax=Thiohalobacter sp. IOR34 TaxID=3057176 RepID=UPI0025B12078|nr:hypothetical protein [Thiohalobacter sp. IOR34]WJW76874.1 hypothetical protein QVG61_06880 [Thiohalobacter sp. IOR34]